MKSQQHETKIQYLMMINKIKLLLLAFILSVSTITIVQAQQGSKTAIDKLLSKTSSSNKSSSKNTGSNKNNSSTSNKNNSNNTSKSNKPKKPDQNKSYQAAKTIKNADNQRIAIQGKGVNVVRSQQQVIFKTGASAVEVLLNGNSIGTSDNSGRLTISIAKGEHNVGARKYNKDLFEQVKINVTDKQNSFDLSAGVAEGINKLLQAQNQSVNPKNQAPLVEVAQKPAPTLNIAAILEAYADPQRTDSVKTAEWQAIYEDCLKKMLDGSTENNVEGLCSFAQGQLELATGNIVKAVNLFSAAAVFLPGQAIVQYGLGNAHFFAGNEMEAINAYNKTIQLDKNFALAYKKLGDINLAMGKTKEAAAKYQAARGLGMLTPELRFRIAEIQVKNKQCTFALNDLEALRREAPNVDIYVTLSECYVAQNRSAEAIQALESAIKLNPNAPVPHYKIGVIYLEQKQYARAKESLERALVFDPNNRFFNRKELQKLIEKAQKRSR